MSSTLHSESTDSWWKTRARNDQNLSKWRRSSERSSTSHKYDQPRQRKVLPKILCFHGAGSSGIIFKIQAIRLAQRLRNEFELVFIDAPFETTPGPGVLPTFEDSGPFWRWQCDVSATEKFDITHEEIREERIRMRRHLVDVFRSNGQPQIADLLDTSNTSHTTANNAERETDSDAGKIVGLLAFSQGTRVVTGLLAELNRLLRQKARPGQYQDLKSFGLKFAVLVCGTYAALPLAEDEDRMTFTSLPLSRSSFTVEENLKRHQHLDHYDMLFSHDESSNDSSAESSTNSSADNSDNESLSSANTDYGEDWNDETDQKGEYIHPKISIPSIHFHGLKDPWLAEAQQLLYDCYSNARIFEFDGEHRIPTKSTDLEILKEAVCIAYTGKS